MHNLSWLSIPKALVVALLYQPYAYARAEKSIECEAPGYNAGPAESHSGWHQIRDEDSKFYEFVTRPDIGAPKWSIDVHNETALAPGYWFMAPYANLEQVTFPKWNGPHIYDSDGELIWSGAPLFDHQNTFDFRIVQYQGKDMLSLIFPEDRNREGVILDNHYEIHKAVDLRGELDRSNMHDFTVVNNGTRALTLTEVKERATVEQSKVIGFDGECRVGWEGFKELRVEDNKVLFEWSAKDWIGLDECMFIPSPPDVRCNKWWDILHLNSIDKFDNGDYLISSRHMDALYRISHIDGHIVWRLGGKKSDFVLTGEAVFSRQHHARFRGENETHTLISVFDNAHGDGPKEAQHPTNEISRGLVLALRTDTNPMTAELAAHYDHPTGGITNSRGSVQFLPNGNIFMGWTYGSRQSEHTADGELLMEAHFREGQAHSYRNYKFPWVGRPSIPPDVHSIAVKNGNAGNVTTVVSVSWNGATDVKSWRLFKSTADGEAPTELALVPRQGFETTVTIDGFAAFVSMEALDRDGEMIEVGRSGVVRTIQPADIDGPEVEAEMQWLQQAAVTSDESQGFWSSLLSLLGNPIFLFAVGFVCSGVLTYSLVRWRSYSSESGWAFGGAPLYGRLSGGLPRYNDALDRNQEDAHEFELDPDEKFDDDEVDESSDSLLQRRSDRAA